MEDLLWLVLGLGLIVTEAFTLSLVLGMFGVGALAAAAVAFAGAPVAAQVAAFSVTSLAMLLLVRPPLQNALDKGGADDERTDARALAGSSALVVERVDDDGGQVRLHGELWRARPYAGGPALEVGAAVCVAAVEGATLLVYDPT